MRKSLIRTTDTKTYKDTEELVQEVSLAAVFLIKLPWDLIKIISTSKNLRDGSLYSTEEW